MGQCLFVPAMFLMEFVRDKRRDERRGRKGVSRIDSRHREASRQLFSGRVDNGAQRLVAVRSKMVKWKEGCTFVFKGAVVRWWMVVD